MPCLIIIVDQREHNASLPTRKTDGGYLIEIDLHPNRISDVSPLSAGGKNMQKISLIHNQTKINFFTFFRSI